MNLNNKKLNFKMKKIKILKKTIIKNFSRSKYKDFILRKMY